MKTVKLNALTITKDGQPLDVMGVTEKDAWDESIDIVLDDENMQYVSIVFPKEYKEFFLVMIGETGGGTYPYMNVFDADNNTLMFAAYVVNKAGNSAVNTGNFKTVGNMYIWQCLSSADGYGASATNRATEKKGGFGNAKRITLVGNGGALKKGLHIIVKGRSN